MRNHQNPNRQLKKLRKRKSKLEKKLAKVKNKELFGSIRKFKAEIKDINQKIRFYEIKVDFKEQIA